MVSVMCLVIFCLNISLFYMLGCFFQLTIGRIGLSCLCSFIVPYKYGALGFMFIYLRFSSYFIMFLHLLNCFCVFVWCLLATSFGSLVKLLLIMSSSVFLHNHLYTLSQVYFLFLLLLLLNGYFLFLSYTFKVFHSYFYLFILFLSVLDISLFNSFCKLFASL
jgi:hypothetical protein